MTTAEPNFTFHRIFESDLRQDGLIPAALLHHPELAALEVERKRLAAAFDEATDYGGHVDDGVYIAQRAAALREGRDLPSAPPTAAEAEADAQNRRRNYSAARDALLAFGETLRRTLAAHPEWADEAAGNVQAARDEVAERQRQAQEAEQRAQEQEHYERWLRRGAAGELYMPTFVPPTSGDNSDIVWAVTDPSILDLIARSRSGQAI